MWPRAIRSRLATSWSSSTDQPGARDGRRSPARRSAPGRSRSRAMARRRAGQGRGGDARAPGSVPDLLGHRGGRSVHPGRRGQPRGGAGPRPAGRVPLHPGRAAHDVPRALLDDAPVRGLRDGVGDERAFPLSPAAGPDRALGGLRPAHPDGLRQRRAGGRGRGGPGRRSRLLARRHGDPLRRDPARRRQHLDDDQRHGRHPARSLRGGRRGPGRAPGPGVGDHPERHPEGVHRPRHVHLPASPVDAPGDRHLRVLRPGAAALEHHQHQRLPHARGRGDRGPGAGVHDGRRDRLRRGRRGPRARRRRSSRAACRSSSPPGASSSRRWPSSGRLAGSGHASSATDSALPIPAP